MSRARTRTVSGSAHAFIKSGQENEESREQFSMDDALTYDTV